MDWTLAWRSLSTFMIIFIAISVFIIVYNLMFTGTKPLVMHLSVKMLWLL